MTALASAEERVTATTGHARSASTSHLSTCADLALADLLVRLRVSWGVASVRRLLPLVVLTTLLLCWIVLAIISASFVPPGDIDRLSVLVALDVGLVLYGGLVQVAGEALTRRRFSYSGSPHREALRALDLSPLSAFTAFELAPRLPAAVAAIGAQLVIVARFGAQIGGLGSVSLVLLPVALTALRLSLALHCATRPAAFRVPRTAFPTAAAVGVAAGAAGAALADTVRSRADGVPVTGLDPSQVADRIGPAVHYAGGAAVLCLVVGSIIALRALPVMRASGHRVWPTARQGLSASTPSALLRGHLARSWAGAAVDAQLLAGTTIAAALVSATWLAPHLTLDPAASSIHTVLVVSVFVAFLGLEDSLVRVVGVGRFATQWHWAWASGHDATRLTVAILGVLLLPYAVLGALASLGVTALVDETTLWPFGLAITVGAACALNDALLPPMTGSDGTTLTNPLSTFLSLLFAAPALGVLLWRPPATSLFVLIIAVLTTGGAWCSTRRRLPVLPLNWLR